MKKCVRHGNCAECGEHHRKSKRQRPVAITAQAEDYHGAAWSVPLADDQVSVVHLLCVAPQWQGKGIARMTMQRVMAMRREMGKKAVRLDALACNTPAQRLYEALGFQKRAQRRWYADNVGWTDFFYLNLCYKNRKQERKTKR